MQFEKNMQAEYQYRSRGLDKTNQNSSRAEMF